MADHQREGNLEAPSRHPLNWQAPAFYDEGAIFKELERIFDICHGCRRCVSLCHAFPTLFDLIDSASTMEVDGVDKQDYWKVVEHCYLCDMCYMSKCPYVPPHPWNVDFPKLMLRAKAFKFKRDGASRRDRLLSSTDQVGRLASIPVVVQMVNAANRSQPLRKVLDKALGVHPDAVVPQYHHKTAHKRLAGLSRDTSPVGPAVQEQTAVLRSETPSAGPVPSAGPSHVGLRGRVAVFATCYGNYNQPELVEDLVKVLQHNGIAVRLVGRERCCGMPKFENGDLESVDRAKQANIPILAKMVDEGWDIVGPVPSCVLMFKQELPLMYPDDPEIIKVRNHVFDPFEYLMAYHRAGRLNTDFKQSLGKIAYHAPCHLRVQNIGLKTRELLSLVQDTELEAIERCSGHNGTYAVKHEFHETAMKIGRPVFNRVAKAKADYYSSDCPMAGEQIQNGLRDGRHPTHPLTLLRMAYGIE